MLYHTISIWYSTASVLCVMSLNPFTKLLWSFNICHNCLTDWLNRQAWINWKWIRLKMSFLPKMQCFCQLQQLQSSMDFYIMLKKKETHLFFVLLINSWGTHWYKFFCIFCNKWIDYKGTFHSILWSECWVLCELLRYSAYFYKW